MHSLVSLKYEMAISTTLRISFTAGALATMSCWSRDLLLAFGNFLFSKYGFKLDLAEITGWVKLVIVVFRLKVRHGKVSV